MSQTAWIRLLPLKTGLILSQLNPDLPWPLLVEIDPLQSYHLQIGPFKTTWAWIIHWSPLPSVRPHHLEPSYQPMTRWDERKSIFMLSSSTFFIRYVSLNSKAFLLASSQEHSLVNGFRYANINLKLASSLNERAFLCVDSCPASFSSFLNNEFIQDLVYNRENCRQRFMCTLTVITPVEWLAQRLRLLPQH